MRASSLFVLLVFIVGMGIAIAIATTATTVGPRRTDGRAFVVSPTRPLAPSRKVDFFSARPVALTDFGYVITDIQRIPGSGEYAVATKDGRVWRWTPEKPQKRQLWFRATDVHDGGMAQPGQEQGFLGLAFHPAFSTNRRFYCVYVTPTPTGLATRLEEWKATDGPPPTPVRTLLQWDVKGPYHYGGQARFGPDGYLYVSVGEGCDSPTVLEARSRPYPKRSLLGSILRLELVDEDPGYVVPPSNPLVAVADARPEVWAFGLRNTWRFNFDVRGRLFAADVGQSGFEELNWVLPGEYYGWPYFEADECTSPTLVRRCRDFTTKRHHARPLFAYGRDKGAAILVGDVYQGAAFPALRGALVFTDMITARLWALQSDSDAPERWHVLELGKFESIFPTVLASTVDGEILLAALDGMLYVVRKQERSGASGVSSDSALPTRRRQVFPTEDAEGSGSRGGSVGPSRKPDRRGRRA
jgi:glucose/arabinose dehydrogenase